MSLRRQRKGGHAGGHEGPDERWMASYMDMVTVLMCLFIVLYAMSTVDKDKFEKLRLALATGFGTTHSKTVDTATGVVVAPQNVGKNGVDLTAFNEAQQEVDKLQQLEKHISANLRRAGLRSAVDFTIDSRGLTVKLVGSSTFFDGNSANLRDTARRVLNAIGPVIRGLPNTVSVEGHADQRGSPAPFPTDWELSSARATTVLRYLVEQRGLSPSHIVASAYGSAHPLPRPATASTTP